MSDFIVVGSGAAGVAAALQLVDDGLRPVMLDVGHARPENLPRAEGNLYSYRRRHDTYDLLIGERLEGLSNLLAKRPVPVKLTAPNLRYVTHDAERLCPIDEVDFCAIQSFAAGGLANAWGAGVYRFVDDDLAGFPIREKDLGPYFDRLTREIGISGTRDDLAPFWGAPDSLDPPLRLSHNMRQLYGRYRRKRSSFHERGIHIGQAHVAVLTRDKDGRGACQYTNTEMCQESPAVYSPAMTLAKLVKSGQVVYRPGVLVETWSEDADRVRVHGLDLSSGERVQITGRALILAAGAINTSRIVLRSRNDYRTRLTLLENPALQIPLLLPRSIGRALETDAFGLVQLNLIWNSDSFGARLQGSIMELTSPMRAEFFGRLPYCARENVALLRYLLPAAIVMQLFFPADRRNAARLSLQPNGRLRIEGSSPAIDVTRTAALLSALRSIGAWAHPSLIVTIPMGHAVHYAATLAMREEPRPYECDPCGRLSGTRAVYVADSACFSALPAKNMSFTMMANAMRIAGHAVRRARDSV